jgi:pimeloyl-ACP methyl ester carboxylesterase
MPAKAPARATPLTPERIAGISKRVEIRTGRLLGVAAFGSRQAPPILYCHGFPGCRIEPGILAIEGLHIIGIDRPGYALSSDARPEGNALHSFARDAVRLADALAIPRFALLGLSGGAPYAAAIAALAPERVASLALVSGLGPPEAPGMAEGRIGVLRLLGQAGRPGGLALSLARRAILSKSATDMFVRLRRAVAKFECARDAEAFTADFASGLLACWREALYRSTAGARADARAYGEPWPFALEDIRVPTYVFHGLEDRIVPATIGDYVAQRIPGAEACVLPNEGHISLIVNHWRAVMTALLRHW